MIQIAPICVAAALATTPVLAQEFVAEGERVLDEALIAACATAKIGAPECEMTALAESLGLLTAGDVRVFGDIGMESFAMLTALRYAASAMFFLSEGDGCYAEEERAAAIEIWSLWVSLPNDAPKIIAEKFALYEGIMDKVVALELSC